MRAVIQLVKEASVTVSESKTASIGPGLLVLLGIEEADNIEDVSWLAQKIARMRIFPDDDGKMNLSVQNVNGEILVVSQFTLHASTRKGNRPSFIQAAHPDIAQPLYENFVQELQQYCNHSIQTGEFGAMMEVELVNNGPVTILIDTKNKE